jgi:hypothetical protein
MDERGNIKEKELDTLYLQKFKMLENRLEEEKIKRE